MFGDPVCAGHSPIIETGRIIVCHRLIIVGIIFIHKTDFFDGIIFLIELLKNFQKIIRNDFISE